MTSILALCPVCDNPVSIAARGWVKDRDGRPVRQAWQVQPHTAADDDSGGRQCDGTGKVV